MARSGERGENGTHTSEGPCGHGVLVRDVHGHIAPLLNMAHGHPSGQQSLLKAKGAPQQKGNKVVL